MKVVPVRECDKVENAEEKEQRLWDEHFASAEGIVARPLPMLIVVDVAVTIVAPGASIFERYGSYYRLRQQSDGGVDRIQVQCMLGCGSKLANVATKGRDTAVKFSNQGKHLRAVHWQLPEVRRAWRSGRGAHPHGPQGSACRLREGPDDGPEEGAADLREPPQRRAHEESERLRRPARLREAAQHRAPRLVARER